MTFLAVLLAGMVLTSGVAVAQTTSTAATLSPLTADGVKVFRASIVKQKLALRNFSGDLSVQTRWNGKTLEWQKSYWHAVGVMKVDSVTVKDNKMLIRGDRAIVLKDPAKGYVSSREWEPVEVAVVLDGDPATSLDGLKAALFFDSIAEAAAGVPVSFRDRLPADMEADLKNKPRSATADTCDCVDRGTPACDGKRQDGWERPKVLSSADPSYTDDARQHRINGDVLLTLALSETGNINDLWIARPLGHGLDEQAAYAIRKYRFSPATCHGKGARTELSIGVNFQIY